MDQLRALVPFFALTVAVLAAVSDPASTADLILAAIPVGAFAAWGFTRKLPLPVLSLAVVIPVVVAQRDGQLEPLMFEVSLLALVVGGWAASLGAAAALGLLAVAAPVTVSVVQDPSEVEVGIWIVGIAFPWLVARAMARQGNWQPSSTPRGASWPSRRCWRSGVGSPATSMTSWDTGSLP